MWRKDKDGSVLDRAGKVVYFSLDRFVRDVCLGDCCFICGANPADVPFNNEHVIPEWLLRRYNLFALSLTLPNGSAVRYDRYTVPCCASCNTLIGIPAGEDEGILPEHPQWLGWVCILAGPLMFIICGRFGFIPATFACVFVSALGDRTATWKSALVLAAVVTVFGVAVFSYLLQIPMPLWYGFGVALQPHNLMWCFIGVLVGDTFRQVGVYRGQILQGAKPADLPVQLATRFRFVINLKTAKALGLNISDNLLTLVDEVIE
jgi:hypothetical protein